MLTEQDIFEENWSLWSSLCAQPANDALLARQKEVNILDNPEEVNAKYWSGLLSGMYMML